MSPNPTEPKFGTEDPPDELDTQSVEDEPSEDAEPFVKPEEAPKNDEVPKA